MVEDWVYKEGGRYKGVAVVAGVKEEVVVVWRGGKQEVVTCNLVFANDHSL